MIPTETSFNKIAVGVSTSGAAESCGGTGREIAGFGERAALRMGLAAALTHKCFMPS